MPEEKGVRDPEIIDPCELRLRPLRARIVELEGQRRDLLSLVLVLAEILNEDLGEE